MPVNAPRYFRCALAVGLIVASANLFGAEGTRSALISPREQQPQQPVDPVFVRLRDQSYAAEREYAQRAKQCDREAAEQSLDEMTRTFLNISEAEFMRVETGGPKESQADVTESDLVRAFQEAHENCPTSPPPIVPDEAWLAIGTGYSLTRAIDTKPQAKSPAERWLIFLLASAGAPVAVVATRGGGETVGPVATPLPETPPVQQVNPTPSPAPPSPAPPTPPALTPTSFNGTYGGNLSATGNGCGFPPSAAFNAQINVNTAGAGTLQMTYLAFGQQQPYVFNNMMLRTNGNQGSIDAQTNSSQFGYQLNTQLTLSGTTMAGTLLFIDPARGNCQTTYSLNGTRQ